MQRILLIFFIFILVSCDPPGTDENKGQIILSSAYDFNNYTISGYNFELNAYSPFPSASEKVPDIIVDKYMRVNGDILPGFSSPTNNNGFALVSESGSLAEAVEFFNAYNEFDPSLSLSPTSDTVRAYQVWVLKTRLDNYIKLNVRDIRVLNNIAGDYIEVSLDYHYQDDGTPEFSK